MSIECLHDPGQLTGLPYEVAKLYGMPHIGARYTSDDVDRTGWLDDYPSCACCGRVSRRASKHHEPPKGKGRNFNLVTPMGAFVLKPALIALCGSGTTGCHGDRHNGRLRIRWEWDSDDYERMWWDGSFLKRGLEPNGQWLFGYGRYVFGKDGREWEVRL